MAAIETPVTIGGRYLWTNEERFIIKGVVYQIRSVVRSRRKPGPLGDSLSNTHAVAFESRSRPNPLCDPLADEHLDLLEASIALFRELGLNTIYVYSIDNAQNHDRAMQMLAEAGIYVIIGLSTPNTSINRLDPESSYNDTLLQNYFRTIDCMAKYVNTLGVIVANSVINSVKCTAAATIIRATVRDVKAYMSLAKETAGQRVLPVGVSSCKIMNIVKTEFEYFVAGDAAEAVDFFCFNEYSWVGVSSLQISGYNSLLRTFENSPVPVFFSEYGANVTSNNQIGTRQFHETCAIYSPAMTRVYSGACAYEFFEAVNRYGLIEVRPDGDTYNTDGAGGWRFYKNPDYENLKLRLQECKDEPLATEAEWCDSRTTNGRRPEMPELGTMWKAGKVLPSSPVEWGTVRTVLEDREWVLLPRNLEGIEIRH